MKISDCQTHLYTITNPQFLTTKERELNNFRKLRFRSLDAIMEMANAEGILLDPVYSSKVFSGLLAHMENGRWSAKANILMLHSGGVPALFAYQNVIKALFKKEVF